MVMRALSLFFVLSSLVNHTIASDADGRAVLEWSPLPSLLDSPGVASPFVGTSNGVLLVAGGANFPEAPPWKNGKKVWHDDIYALIDHRWQIVGKLSTPLAYGVSLQTTEGVLCIGGSDNQRHRSEVFLMRFAAGRIEFESLPSLPLPIANATGVLAGSTAYIAGGTDSPTATTALSKFLSIDLKAEEPRWHTRPDVPGTGRMLSVAATDQKSIFIFSGASLAPGDDGKPGRTYLRDTWQFLISRNTWERRADLPYPVVAAPSPAPLTKSGNFVILGGDDGSNVGYTPPENHPGFAKSALIYEPLNNRWSSQTTLRISRVTVPAAAVSDGFVLASGEIRPGVRSPEVWHLIINEQE